MTELMRSGFTLDLTALVVLCARLSLPIAFRRSLRSARTFPVSIVVVAVAVVVVVVAVAHAAAASLAVMRRVGGMGRCAVDAAADVDEDEAHHAADITRININTNEIHATPTPHKPFSRHSLLHRHQSPTRLSLLPLLLLIVRSAHSALHAPCSCTCTTTCISTRTIKLHLSVQISIIVDAIEHLTLLVAVARSRRFRARPAAIDHRLCTYPRITHRQATRCTCDLPS
jgi:hypothetical protein